MIRSRILAPFLLLALCGGLVLGTPSPAAATWCDTASYYLSATGNDANTGTSVSQAWRSVNAINSRVILPGTCIWLEGGSAFDGKIYLAPDDAGDSTRPVVIGSYGNGRAVVNAGMSHGIAVYNTAGVIIQDLDIVGDGYVDGQASTNNDGSGVWLYADSGGAVKHDYVVIQRVDVSGFVDGITISGRNRSGFSDVTVQYASVHDNADAGVQAYGDIRTPSSAWTDYAHSNVTIQHVAAYANPGMPGKVDELGRRTNSGSGIVVGDVDGAVIQNSEAWSNGELNDYAGGGPVGIWTYDSNDVLIQYNVSRGNRSGTVDGDGFDFDGGVTNSTMQYNYSHDNDGAGYLVFQYAGARPMFGNAVRWNISQNDGRKGDYGAITTGSYGTPAQGVDIVNNSIFMSAGPGRTAGIRIWEGSHDVVIANNSIHVTGGIPLVSVESGTTTTFVGNNYYAPQGFLALVGGVAFDDTNATPYTSLAAWRSGTGAETLGSTQTGQTSIPGYGDPSTITSAGEFWLHSGSAMALAGVDLGQLGITPAPADYFGTAIPAGGPFSIGASQ